MKKRLVVLFVCLTSVFLPGFALGYTYGTIWDESLSDGTPADAQRLAGEYQAGLRLKNVTLSWADYEPSQGNFSASYVSRKKEEIRQLRQAGFSIVLRINPFPVPAWLFDAYPNARLKNQYGREWDPESHGHSDVLSSSVSFWEPGFKTRYNIYMGQVFQDLGNNFWAVYLGIGKWGEADFPETHDYWGHDNCYWGWDSNARADIAAKYPAAAAYVPGAIGIAGERLVNGGFEDTRYPATIANWESSVDCLNVAGWAPVVAADAGQAREGSRYLHYATPCDSGGKHYLLRQSVVLNPNTAYTFSGWLRPAADTAGFIRLTQPDATGQWQERFFLTSANPDWSQLGTTYTSVSYTTQARLELGLETANGSGSVDFDRLSLTDGQNVDHAPACLFYQWYIESMAAFIQDRIAAVKQHYDGPLILMVGGFAARSGDVEAEINNDFTGASYNGSWVCRGAVPDRYLALLTDLKQVWLADTGMEAAWASDVWGKVNIHNPAWEASPLQYDWSAPHYMAWLADQYQMGKFAENGGSNATLDMANVFAGLTAYGYRGLGWYTTSQLFQSGLASLTDYANAIAAAGGTEEPDGYLEHFTGAAAATPPAWRNDSNATIAGDGASSGTIQLQASGSAGNVISPVLRDLNTAIFDTLEVKLDQISAGAYLDIGLQEERGRYRYIPAFTHLAAAGTYQTRLDTIVSSVASADLGCFSVKIWINGTPSASTATLDSLRIFKSSGPLAAKPATQPVVYALRTGWEAGDPCGPNAIASAANLTGLAPDSAAVCRAENSGWLGVAAQTGSRCLFLSAAARDSSQTAGSRTTLFAAGGGQLPVAIDSQTKWSYWIFHRQGSGIGNAAVALDLHCTDGTLLSTAGLRDQRGLGLRPQDRPAEYNQWIYVWTDLASLAGKTIDRIDAVFQTSAAGLPHQTFIDNLKIYTGAAPGMEPAFAGWETGEMDTFENAVYASNHVGGYQSGNPECGSRAAEAEVPVFRGNRYLMVAGNAGSAPAYCYYWLMDDGLQPFYKITIEAGMKLVYRIYHYQNQHVAVDFHCTDGTELRNAGVVDQNGVNLHPAGRNEPLGQWSQVVADLSSLAGKVIDRVMIGFDETSQPGQYRAYIDDLEFTHNPMPAVATLSPTVTATITPTATPTPSVTVSPTSDLRTRTPTPTVSATPSASPTATASPTNAWPWAANQVLVYPNPARDRVTFAYQAAGPVRVEIDLYRLTGERVARIREQHGAGSGSVQTTVWDARNCAAGIYLARIVVVSSGTGERLKQIRKVALVR